MGIFSQGKGKIHFNYNFNKDCFKSEKIVGGEGGRLRRQSDDEYRFVPINRESAKKPDKGVLTLLKDEARCP